jgi:hypothetical protein
MRREMARKLILMMQLKVAKNHGFMKLIDNICLHGWSYQVYAFIYLWLYNILEGNVTVDNCGRSASVAVAKVFARDCI